MARSPGRDRRLAILPLRDIAETPGKAYFAAGLTEELISVLSRVRNLEIIASSSSSRYSDPSIPLSRIADELNVGALLQGSVRSVARELRVSIRLVDARSGSLVWSEDYDRSLEEIFAVQREIAESVADALAVTVHESEAARIGDAPTPDLEAYDLYLLGRYELNKRSEPGLLRSIEHFRAALGKDASFAAAYSGIADAYVLASIGYADVPQDVAMREARKAAEVAIRAEARLSDAHTSRGFVLLNFDWDWDGAQAEFETALELNPSDARAYQWFGQCMSYQGRYEEAIPLTQRARELDPRSALISTEAGWPFLYLGRLEEASAQFERALDIDEGFALAHFNAGNILEMRGDLPAALAKYEHAARPSVDSPMISAFRAGALARLGRMDESRQVLKNVIDAADGGAPFSVYVAHAYEALGDRDEALNWLERAAANREPLLLGIGTAWLPFTSLQKAKRYQTIAQQLPAGVTHSRAGG